MTVLLYFSALVTICAFIGWGIHGLLAPDNDTPPGTTLAVGYAVGVFTFFPAYFILSSASKAAICVLLIAAIANGTHALRVWVGPRHGENKNVVNGFKNNLLPYMAFVFVVVFSAAPYMMAGVGNYWHTANEDIFDGLNGRNAYIQGALLAHYEHDEFLLAATTRGGLEESLQNNIWDFTGQKNLAFFKDRYVNDLGRLQYSSLAFFTELLRLPKGMDVFLLQALLNVGLFALGVHAFVRRIFCQSQIASTASAVIASMGNFYLTTYFNGHEGSLMYNAVVPLVFYFLVRWVQDVQPTGRILLIPALLLVMVIGAYPFPLPYIIAPVVFFYVLKRFFSTISGELSTLDGFRRHQKLIIVSGIFVLLAFIAAYLLAEPIRLRALGQFRSWGTIHNHIGFLQFWGIWPSGIAYTSTPLGWLDAYLPIKSFSLLLACALSFVAIYGSIRLLKQKIYFLLAWLPIAIFFFFVMRYAVYDSYYLYKYLYINAWIVYALTVVGMINLARNRHEAIKLLVFCLAICWVGSNLANNASAMWEISSKPFNKNAEKYYAILNAPKDILERSYIAIPRNDHADLIRQILSEGGIATVRDKTKANFILSENGIDDVLKETQGKSIWKSAVFSLATIPGNDITELATFWGIEGETNPFRWVSDGKNGTLLLGLNNRTKNSKYLFMCGESGPSVEYRPVIVSVFDAEKRLVGAMTVSSYGCHVVDVSQYRPPFSLEHNETGIIASYIDQRKLVYRIMHIGFSATDEIDETFYALNNGRDIIDEKYSRQGASPRINLGANWYSFETYQGESFRWARDYPEIIVSGQAGAGLLTIDVAPGPSAGKDALNLEIINVFNNAAGKCIVKERRICTFPLIIDAAKGVKLRIHSDALNIAGPVDPRILNFRVFNIGWR